ncbi:MAG: hypothetical protein K8R41_06730 [Bacteroidales bacterium]|nr:hypothetical protein [Bacteroidales bacterium]MCD4773062.1 hypothetical protein [Bacteroidales bacterium]
MQKYSFLVYHKEYGDFLKNLQELGVLHVIEKETEISDDIKEKYQLVNRIDKIIKSLEKRETEKTDNCPDLDGLKIIEEIIQKQKELDTLHQELATTHKELIKIKPWGDFSAEIINKLKDENFYLKFFLASKKKFNTKLLSEYNAEIITESGNHIYFIIIQQGDEKLNIDAEEIKQPESSLSEIEKHIKEIEEKITLINNDFDNYSETSIPLLIQEREAIATNLEFEKVILNTAVEADEKMKILEGWVPKTKKKQIDDFLDKSNILHIIDKATKKDKVPVLLQNNRFSKLFEPIGKLFSLPAYSELDLTVFFAPFFMMFFGFCLGDAGYGLLFVIGAGIYKLKAKKEIKPILSLVQFLGLATIIFGIISGTLFGIDLIDENTKLFANYKDLFLNPDNMFNLALALGALQIIFGMFIKAANQIKQYGFMHSLATFGWLIILIGGGIYAALTKLEYIAANNIILYTILSLGGFLIIFFSDVEISIPARIGKGVWDIYSTVTGIFGDLLSYIRLFALGLSSGILGLVINNIAMQILGSSPILGPVFFVIFLILGHGLNILISSLGSFVHPMRLTFVEFYKNAGFTGGGKEYKPFSG